MRTVAILLAVLSSTAAADDDEAPGVEPVPRFTAGLYFTGHGGEVGGLPEGGMGPTAEVAYGAGRAQYFVEAGVAWVTVGPQATAERGFQVRGGLGARWIARSLDIERSGAVEMTLEALAGAHKFWWSAGGELARPELGLGIGFQLRKYRRPHVSVRLSMRVFWAPASEDAEVAVARCAGDCAAPSSPLTSGGIMVSIGGAR